MFLQGSVASANTFSMHFPWNNHHCRLHANLAHSYTLSHIDATLKMYRKTKVVTVQVHRFTSAAPHRLHTCLHLQLTYVLHQLPPLFPNKKNPINKVYHRAFEACRPSLLAMLKHHILSLLTWPTCQTLAATTSVSDFIHQAMDLSALRVHTPL